MTTVYCLFQIVEHDKEEPCEVLVAIFQHEEDAKREKKHRQEQGGEEYSIAFWNVQ